MVNNKTKIKPELVVPVGNLEKLKIACMYGADAVYLGGELFNLRINAGNFAVDELREAVIFAHEQKKKIYFTLNSFMYEKDFPSLHTYLDTLKGIPFDGVIVVDPGILDLVRSSWPEMRIHLSTQSNTLNSSSVRFWARNGISRVILARELTIPEIASISKQPECETEVFIQGAVCLSFSGRCYLSKYMADRDANLGDCAQNCRWRYALVEEKRPGEYYPVFEENEISYILNAKDICSIRVLPEIIETGVRGLKIEGRMKSIYYLAVVTMVYRQAIDSVFSKKPYCVKPEWIDELEMLSHRPYNYTPYSGEKTNLSQDISRCIERGIFLGLVVNKNPDGYISLSVRNSLRTGEKIDIISPQKVVETTLMAIRDNRGDLVAVAHPNQDVTVKLDKEVEPGFLLRRRTEEKQERSPRV